MTTRRDKSGRRFYWKYALLVFLIALTFRAVYLYEASHSPGFNLFYMDEAVHLEWARGLSTGEWKSPYDQLTAGAYFRAPLYPYVLAGMLVLSGQSTLGVRILQIVMGAVSCALVYALGARCFGNRTGLVAGMLSALYWVLVYFDTQLLLPVLLVFLLLAGLLLLLIAAERGSPALAGAAGLTLGLFAITRPNILLFFPFVFLWGLKVIRRPSPLPGRWFVILLVLGLILPPAAVTLRNRVVADDWVVIASQGGVNFYIGNNPDSDGLQAVVPGTRQTWWGGYEDTKAIAEEARGRPLKASEVSDYWFGRAFEYIREDTAGWLRLTLRKTLALVGAAEPPNNEPYEVYRRSSWSLRAVPLNFAILFGLFLVSLPRMAAIRRGLKGRGSRVDTVRSDFIGLMILLVVVYSITIIAFFVTGRYRVPLLPVLAIGAAVTLVGIFDSLRRHKLRSAVLAVVAAVLVATCLSFDYLKIRERTAGFADLSLAADLLDSGDADGAIVRLEKVRRDGSVKAPELYKGLARAYLARGRPGDRNLLLNAVDEGLALYPDEPELIWYSAVGHVEREDWPVARERLSRFLKYEPGNIRAIYLSFVVAMALGDRDAAESYYRMGEAIDSGHQLVNKMRLDLGY